MSIARESGTKPEKPDHEHEHARVGSWFLGPRAENFDVLKDLFASVLKEQEKARKTTYSQDQQMITSEMKDSDKYKTSIENLKNDVRIISENLAKHSVPFWSPRYNAHMNMDTTLSGIIGYMAAMMYNQNNAATEGGPFTTLVERQVGRQLCKLLGYNIKGEPSEEEGQEDAIFPWGHITCGGSVANLEAIWAARNLKFYPLSLKLAMEPGNELAFLTTTRRPFIVTTCKGKRKPFKDLKTWELLNLKPSTILSIPTRLYKQYGLSSSFLESALSKHLIQTVGKDALERKFKINPAKFFISTTKHYSWPKGGAITGIGSENFVDIKIDYEARMDIKDLRKHLNACMKDEIPVFGVVAIIGSTEHGACDPVMEIHELRREYRKRGLSFIIHCDAAWGGYFASLIPRIETPERGLPFVPTLGLLPYTQKQLKALKVVDSITIDPHKSGYINYPAGGLCYRDGRMRHLITWTSPIVFHAGDELESMGVYGVEGSKPGASPVAVWLTHKTLGLTADGDNEVIDKTEAPDDENMSIVAPGYARLLGEALFTCTKIYCYWATIVDNQSDLIVVPLTRLPVEKGKEGSEDTEDTEVKEEDIERQKTAIREQILGVSNHDLMSNKGAVKLLGQLGGDLMINAFACNFRIGDKPNTNVGEANYLNTRIFKRLSISTMKDDIKEKPLILTESRFEEAVYGECLDKYKRRLQLGTVEEPSAGDLVSLVSVTMSPWPTDHDVLKTMTNEFKRVADEEVKRCIKRNKQAGTTHRFIMQGNETLFLVHLPMFNLENLRCQFTIMAGIPKRVMSKYRELRRDNPDKVYAVKSTATADREQFLKNKVPFMAKMYGGIPSNVKPKEGVSDQGEREVDGLGEFKVTIIKVVVQRPLCYTDLNRTYPERMPFYLYGSGSEYHIDHVLETSPNAQLTADCISVVTQPPLAEEDLESGRLIVELEEVFEKYLQPLPTSQDGQIISDVPGLLFRPGAIYRVRVINSDTGEQVADGDIALGRSVYTDWLEVNKDPADVEYEWEEALKDDGFV